MAPLLQVRNLSFGYGRADQALAVENISFDIARGETVAIVGESGSGKTTLSRLLLGLVQPRGGEMSHDGRPWPPGNGRRNAASRKSVQAIFQNPFDSLDPRIAVACQIAEPLVIHQIGTATDRVNAVREIVEAVRLDPRILGKRPAELSGGECQRVAIARAMIVRPSLVVCDEPLSALDVSVQASILGLLEDFQHRFGVSYLFISHDLRLVGRIADRVAVMFAGRIVEMGRTRDVFADPRHPYTAELLSAVGAGPAPDDPVLPPMIAADGASAGCRFRYECPKFEEACGRSVPPLRAVAVGHDAACHLVAAL